MATYALPTKEQNEQRRSEWRAVIRSRPTWQLQVWLANPRSDGEEAMVREELEGR